MSLITSCPACATIFYVNQEQLSAHHGDVCCGKCQHVFNALDRLVEVPEHANLGIPQPADQAFKISVPEESSESASFLTEEADAAVSAEDAEKFFGQSTPEVKY